MITNPAGRLYLTMEASLRQDTPSNEKQGFFSRGGLQQDGQSKEAATRVLRYFTSIRHQREQFASGMEDA